MTLSAKSAAPSQKKGPVRGKGSSRDKVTKVTRLAVKTYEKAMKELAKH